MAKPAQHPPADFFDGVAMRDLFVTMARALDQSPKEVEYLHGLAIRVLHKKYGSSVDLPQHDLVLELYPAVVAEIDRSKKANEALNKIVERYSKLPSTETIRLAKPGQNSLSKVAPLVLAKAAITGAIIGGIVVGVACLYLAATY